MVSLPFRIYRNTTTLLHPLCSEPLLRLRRYRNPHKEEAGDDHIRHRLGQWDTSFPVHANHPDATTINPAHAIATTIWVHAASAGESIAAVPVLAKILDEIPSSRAVLSVGTKTGRHAAAAILKQSNLQHQVRVVPSPIDTPQAVDGFLLHFQPTMGIMMESELWPNLIHGSHMRRVPLCILNGRLSKKSYTKWKRQGAGFQVLRDMLHSFDLILAQSTADARRYNNVLQPKAVLPRESGTMSVPVVETIPNVKLASLLHTEMPLSKSSQATATAATAATAWDKQVKSAKHLFQRLQNDHDGPGTINVLVASTHDGEEIAVAQAFQNVAPPHLHRVVYVPRHPERAHQVAKELLAVYDDTQLAMGHTDTDGDEVLSLVDPHNPDPTAIVVSAMGMLPCLYAAADVAIVGGSLINTEGNVGQHNVVEPLREGCVVLYGKHSDELFEQEIAARLATAALATNAEPCCVQMDVEKDTAMQQVLRDVLRGENRTKDARREEAMCVVNHVSDGVVEEIWMHLLPWVTGNAVEVEKEE
jgi:3-deoxy-D-manno-octulosonic-acid transferase